MRNYFFLFLSVGTQKNRLNETPKTQIKLICEKIIAFYAQKCLSGPMDYLIPDPCLQGHYTVSDSVGTGMRSSFPLERLSCSHCQDHRGVMP